MRHGPGGLFVSLYALYGWNNSNPLDVTWLEEPLFQMYIYDTDVHI